MEKLTFIKKYTHNIKQSFCTIDDDQIIDDVYNLLEKNIIIPNSTNKIYLYYLGIYYYDKKDYKNALLNLNQSLNDGCGEAGAVIGKYYQYVQHDTKNAKQYYQQSSKLGD